MRPGRGAGPAVWPWVAGLLALAVAVWAATEAAGPGAQAAPEAPATPVPAHPARGTPGAALS